MSNVFYSVLTVIAGLVLAGCSSPYNSLMTPQLISVVEEAQSAEKESPNVCVDPTLSTHRSYLGGYHLKDWHEGIDINPKAGGRVDLAGCFGFEGFSSVIPDVALIADEANAGATITVTAAANRATVLMIHTPDRSFLFAPGEDATDRPTLDIELEAGEYRVWVGTLDADDAFTTTARLTITINGPA